MMHCMMSRTSASPSNVILASFMMVMLAAVLEDRDDTVREANQVFSSKRERHSDWLLFNERKRS